MKIKTDPASIWREYEKCKGYNDNIGLDEQVKQNENFYVGNQWEGLNAPDLDKPVLNFLKRVVGYQVSMLVTDNVGISVESQGNASTAGRLLEDAVKVVVEDNKITAKNRELLRNCAVDGEAYYHAYIDGDGQTIKVEIVDNTNVLFGNPYVADVQEQPYILLVQHMMLATVRDEAEKLGIDPDSIKADGADTYSDYENFGADLVTVITKLWKADNGEHKSVHFMRCTQDVVLKADTDIDISSYPIASMIWERKKKSYHGQATVTGLIANQIAVNKLWAMAIHQMQSMAFPKILFDRTKIKAWTNKVGEAIGVAGDPNQAVASGFRAPDMSVQLTEIVDKTISMTRDFMGASDAALGNVRPENTSAIIALQKASSAPLELQRLAFYQCVEDLVRVIIELICSYYGVRQVRVIDETGNASQALVDYSSIDPKQIGWRVDVGSAAYWSELTQIQTMDNLFSKGIISDAITYLDGIPDAYVKNKNQIRKKLVERQQQMAKMQAMQQAMPQTTSAQTTGGAI